MMEFLQLLFYRFLLDESDTYEARVSINNDMNPNRIQSFSYWNSKEKVWNSERELRRVIKLWRNGLAIVAQLFADC